MHSTDIDAWLLFEHSSFTDWHALMWPLIRCFVTKSPKISESILFEIRCTGKFCPYPIPYFYDAVSEVVKNTTSEWFVCYRTPLTKILILFTCILILNLELLPSCNFDWWVLWARCTHTENSRGASVNILIRRKVFYSAISVVLWVSCQENFVIRVKIAFAYNHLSLRIEFNSPAWCVWTIFKKA